MIIKKTNKIDLNKRQRSEHADKVVSHELLFGNSHPEFEIVDVDSIIIKSMDMNIFTFQEILIRFML